MTEIEKKSEQKVKELDRKARNIVAIPIMIILISPFLVTRDWLGWIDFRATGQIGDTIGGITAPLVGLIAALLVYIGFREQYKANVSQWAALEEEKNIRKKESELRDLERNERKKNENQELVWNILGEEYRKASEYFNIAKLPENREKSECEIIRITIEADLVFLNINLDLIEILLNEFSSSKTYRTIIVAKLSLLLGHYDNISVILDCKNKVIEDKLNIADGKKNSILLGKD